MSHKQELARKVFELAITKHRLKRDLFAPNLDEALDPDNLSDVDFRSNSLDEPHKMERKLLDPKGRTVWYFTIEATNQTCEMAVSFNGHCWASEVVYAHQKAEANDNGYSLLLAVPESFIDWIP